VSQKRFEQNDDSTEQGGPITAAETLRSAGAAGMASALHGPGYKEEEKMSLFWRVFGGTILSITALVIITLYNNINGTITDLRAEVSREREARAGLVKKDDIDARIKTQYDRIRTVEGYKADIETIKERVGANAAAVEGVKKDFFGAVDAIRKDTAGLDVLKERVASVEAVKKDVAAIDGLKEKVVGTAADLKAARDDVQKLQQELEKNRASDLERKSFRDAQAKQLDETLKELQKGMQDCREKIARLEGSQVGPPSPKPPAGRINPAGGPKPTPDE